MFADDRIHVALETLVREVDAPPVPLHDIMQKLSQPHAATRDVSPYIRVAIAAAAAIAVGVAAIPSNSQALARTVDALDAVALRAIGLQPPPRVPQSLLSAMTTKGATLASAQSRVRFQIVPPAGLPGDAAPAEISTTPVGRYSKATHAWRVGSPAVSFLYRRAAGRSFVLIADRFDPQSAPPKYLYEASGPNAAGHVTLVNRENFAWRNGDQLMRVAVGAGIDAREIEAIRTAMHGIPIALVAPNGSPHAGGPIKLFLFPKP